MSDETTNETPEEEQPEQPEQAPAAEPTEIPAPEPEESTEPELEPAAEAETAEAEAEAPAEEPSAADAPAEAAPPVEPEVPVAAEAAATVAETEAPAPEPAKKSKKRLPRALRSKRTRPVRAGKQPGQRKPLSREPKPEGERGARQERRGVVVSSAMDKTIVVRVEILKVHPRYKKVIRRSTKFHAHDELNEAKVGDIVRIVETRPVSRTKRWRLAEVVEAAK